MFKATYMFNCTKRFWQLILIYFTWFVHNFVHHKYNVLLKRNNVCLMPLNTFVCVCVCVSRSFTVKTSSI